MREKLLTGIRLLWTPVLILLVYLGLQAILGTVTADGGLVTPDGSISIGTGILVCLGLGLRLIAIFIVPVLIAYRVLSRLSLLFDRTPTRMPSKR